MNGFRMKGETEYFDATRPLRVDERGCYFDQRTRDFFARAKGIAGKDVEPLEALAAVRMAARHLHLLQERYAESQGLSEGRLQLLFVLRRFGEKGISLGRLAELMRVSPRNVTGLMDNLERAGLVERVPDLADRRSIHARLTPAGRARIDSMWKPTLDKQFPLTRGFTREELVQLRHLCLKLLANAIEMDKEEETR
jgi:DNA-binding MarR family transcriptional regulator